VLAHPPALARLGKLASYHHERLDGSGYHRGVSSDALSTQARILAAADVFVALTEDRTYRPARSKEAALEELQKEALKGRLDPDVVAGVLAAVRQTPTSTARDLTAGLSAREIEVVRLVAQGLTIKQIARTLVIAEKTVDNHIQHIYAKIGVSTRAGATLFAMQHRLLDS
jgi:HD-GYP domain-containing protein (c-di-GMP phosphodiesterase class II)